MNFYRLIIFHTRRCFRTSLSVRVSDSVHPVTYARNFCTNKFVHKIYRCMSALSIWHYTLLHNPMIIYTKTFFAPPCHLRNKILSETKISQSSLIHPHSPHTSLSTSKYDLNTNLSRNISLFPYLGLWLGLVFCYNYPLTHNSYISLHATTWLAYYFYFWVLLKYYHTQTKTGECYKIHILRKYSTLTNTG